MTKGVSAAHASVPAYQTRIQFLGYDACELVADAIVFFHSISPSIEMHLQMRCRVAQYMRDNEE